MAQLGGTAMFWIPDLDKSEAIIFVFWACPISEYNVYLFTEFFLLVDFFWGGGGGTKIYN